MQLICVPPAQAARVWPHVRELILEAMRRGDLSAFRPVEASVLNGDALLWLACSPDGAPLTRADEPASGECPARALIEARHPGSTPAPDVAGAGPASEAARTGAPAHPGYDGVPADKVGGVPRIAAAAVTEIAETEWRKVCVVVACGGTPGRSRPSSPTMSMHHWLPLIDGIETYARANGCAAVRIVGRQGWARVLGQYKTKRIILEKEL